MPDKTPIRGRPGRGQRLTRCVILARRGRAAALSRARRGRLDRLVAKSRLADQQALTACVQEAVRRGGSRSAGRGGRHGGGHRRQSASTGTTAAALYEFGRPRAITIEDMAYAVERSEQVRLEDDRMILHLFPQDFTLDGRSGKRYPRGSTCSRLEANVHLVTVSEQEHDSICAAVHQASYAVEETVFEPVAAAYAAISTRRSRPRRGRGGYRDAFQRPGGLRRRSCPAGAQLAHLRRSFHARCRGGPDRAV